MSARFADAAVRLAGLAGVAFGWRPAHFWAATPAELAALVTAIGGEAGATPPTPETIATLMEAFPDG